MFHRFINQQARRAFGGSDFLELQYCRIPHGAPDEEIVAVDSIVCWEDDSLYVHGDDMNAFYESYCDIFTGGLYNNLSRGVPDFYGINYYSKAQVSAIMQKLETEKPPEYEPLLEWLEKASQYNGIYILGV